MNSNYTSILSAGKSGHEAIFRKELRMDTPRVLSQLVQYVTRNATRPISGTLVAFRIGVLGGWRFVSWPRLGVNETEFEFKCVKY
jgi:hypothetical protein